MNTQTRTNRTELGTLAEDAQALLTATAVGGAKRVEENPQASGGLVARGREVCGTIRSKVVEGAKAMDTAVHKQPYAAIGIAASVGALLGYLIALRHCRSTKDQDIRRVTSRGQL